MCQHCNREGGHTPQNNAVVKFVGGLAALMIMVRFDNSDGRRMARADGKDRPDTRTALTKKIVRHKQTERTNEPNGRTTVTKHVTLIKLNKTRCGNCFQIIQFLK